MPESLSSDVAVAYTAERARRAPAALRLGALVTSTGFVGFAVVDPFVASTSLQSLLLVRLVVLLAIGAVYAASRWQPTAASAELYGVLMLSVVSLGVIALAALAGGGSTRYHDPLALTFVGYAIIIPTAVRYALPAYAGLTASYCGVLLAIDRIGTIPTFLTNAATLILAAFVGLALVVATNRSREREFALQYQLGRAHDDLKAIDGAKSQFFANISHELRTPLTLIIASIETLRESLQAKGSEGPQQLETCRRNGFRLLRLVDDLLELSRLESAALRLKIRTFDLGSMVIDLIAQLAPLAARKQISMSADVPDKEIFTVEADEAQIERVWLNLAANAIKFTGENGRIVLGVRKEGNQYRAWVSDSGEGMSPAVIEHIFERFYQAQTPRNGRRSGVGIGLSLVRRIIELHAGRVTAESTLGQGSTMTFWLPRSADAVDPTRLERRGEQIITSSERRRGEGLDEWDGMLRGDSEYRLLAVTDVTDRRTVSRPAETSTSSRGPVILLVDDNPDILELLAGVLGDAYRLHTAADGRAGLEQAKKVRPDLVISDVMMPHMTGFELLQALRRDPLTSTIPVVLLTARGQDEDRVAASEGGADAYLAKPFHPQELRTTLRNILRKQEATAAAVIDERSLALRVMAEGVAHDTLNPLGFVRGALLILSRLIEDAVAIIGPNNAKADQIAADAKQFFRSGDEGLQRAVAAIGELRRFSRGDTSSQVVRVDVNDAVRRVVTVASTQGKVSTDLLAQQAVSLRAGQLEQVLLNLIINAQQAAGEHSEVILTTWDDPSAHAVGISVRDNGPGMDRTTLQRVFDPYFTTKQMGTGLGLTVSRQIIRDGGGTLGVESQKGEGTTFTIMLPAYVAS